MGNIRTLLAVLLVCLSCGCSHEHELENKLTSKVVAAPTSGRFLANEADYGKVGQCVLGYRVQLVKGSYSDILMPHQEALDEGRIFPTCPTGTQVAVPAFIRSEPQLKDRDFSDPKNERSDSILMPMSHDSIHFDYRELYARQHAISRIIWWCYGPCTALK